MTSQSITIETADDPRVADYRDLSASDSIRARGLFVAEGRLVVERLIADRRYGVRSLLLSPAAAAALVMSLTKLDADVPVYVCAVRHFLGITGFDIHRGCLALVERPPQLNALDIVTHADLIVVLERVANADNVGGVFRNAAAFGAAAVLLSPGCCDPLYRKAIRTSMAASLKVPFAWADDWPGALSALKSLGFTLLALTPREPALSLDEFVQRPRAGRVALLVGAEGAGLTAPVEAAADWRVRIPIAADVDSLNLSVAAGIALSRLSRLTNLSDLA
jgi:tRNA G18 (ribose-2'-O)-methylase SpoU